MQELSWCKRAFGVSAGPVGEALDRVERGRGSGPVLAEEVWAAGAQDAAQHEREDDRIIELADDVAIVALRSPAGRGASASPLFGGRCRRGRGP